MPGRPKPNNDRQNRAGTADECTYKLEEAIHHANEVGNMLDSLIEGQGKAWFELEDQLRALVDRARKLAV